MSKEFSIKLHTIQENSRPKEINYPIYHKEILAIIITFKQWLSYLVRSQHQVKVVTNHKNMVFLIITCHLNRRQACWSIFLADFDLEILYCPSSQQGKVDSLSLFVFLCVCVFPPSPSPSPPPWLPRKSSPRSR